jgi:hypothetical protein
VKRWLGFLAIAALLTLSLGIDECDETDMWFADQLRSEFSSADTISQSPDPEVRAAGETVDAVDREREARKVEVRGSKDFQTWTRSALDLLRSQAPSAYKDVLASIKIVEPVEAGSGIYVDEGRFQVGRGTAYAPNYEPAEQLVWYAGTLVHDACHADLHKQGKVYDGKEGEVACLKRQKAALIQLKGGEDFAAHVQGLIDGADDPANQYWLQPHRHW